MANTTPGTPAYENMLGGLTQTLKNHGKSSSEATRQAYGMISGMIDRQAATMAYVEVISILALVVIFLVPFLLIMRRNKPASGDQAVIH